MTVPKKGQLIFKKRLPYCCGKELGNGYPGIICPECKTEYNADDVTEIVMTGIIQNVRQR